MEFLNRIQLIQGGMGAYISTWRLAKSIARQKPGVTVGTVSGTGLDIVYSRLLQIGDPGGHIRRALSAFDTQFGVEIGRKIIERYYIPGGKAPGARFKLPPSENVHTLDGSDLIPKPDRDGTRIPLSLDEEVVELLIAISFAEVWLAKEGHEGNIFINFLKKIEVPLIYYMYGAMLAGVDGVIVGAGNPDGLPAIRSKLVDSQPVEIDLAVLYREAGESFYVPFDPRSVAGGRLAQKPLKKPAFLAIVSLQDLVQALAASPSEPPDGFIIEHHTAGGHNAGPQGPMNKDSLGQPIYGELDEPDLQAIRAVGLPFWLAGGYGSREKLQQAITSGAKGVQVGTAFALCEESGMKPVYRNAILQALKKGTAEADMVRTTLFSPTGYPFKVVQLENTLSDEAVYLGRKRICDIGLLQQRGLSQPDANGMRRLFHRCQAAPVEDFVSKRGLPRNAEGRRCLCNGLVACMGLGQVVSKNGVIAEEPAIVTLGNHLDEARRLSSNGQSVYWAEDVVKDILGEG
jgi:nitronate monooxygenase